MHPQLRQMPPSSSRSTIAVFSPSCAERIAATYPPGPDPRTMTSYCSAICLSVFLRNLAFGGRLCRVKASLAEVGHFLVRRLGRLGLVLECAALIGHRLGERRDIEAVM